MEYGRLTISRKIGESFYITSPAGERIKICLSAYENGQNKIMIEAPKSFNIVREELVKD